MIKALAERRFGFPAIVISAKVSSSSMELRAKLQIPEGASVSVVNRPPGVDTGRSEKGRPAGILLFVRNSEVLNATVGPAVEAARADRLTWIAYPKGGKLETDLNRDKLWALMKPLGIRPVRQVSIDETWSALRFRPI